MGYSEKFKRGISWAFLFRVTTRVFTILRTAILARLLTPSQFGYFGIASLLLSLLEILTETGINVFLVQQKESISKYINSAFVVSIIRGFLLGVIIFASAGIITSFFNSPEALSIIQLISLVPFIRGFINPAIIIFQKELEFDKEVKLRLSLFSIDTVVAIVLGFVTRDASSFVWGLIASAIVEVLLSHMLFSQKPKFEFEFEKVKLIIHKGSWVTLTGIFSYFSDNGDNIAIGKILGSAQLGIYQAAYKLSTLPISEITNVVNQVVFPLYTKFAEDKIRLKKAFLKVTFLTSLGAIIFGSFIFFFSDTIVLLVMGDQWSAAIPVIKILSIYGILRTSFGSFSALFLSVGKQDYVAKMTFVRVLGLSLTVIPAINHFGMVGAGYAMLFSIILEIPIIIYYTFKTFRLN